MVVKQPFVSCDFLVFFLTKLKKTGNDKIVFYIIVVDQMGVQIIWAHQNDHQNIIFMRDINEVAKKMARNGLKIAKSLGCAFHFESEFTYDFRQHLLFMYIVYFLRDQVLEKVRTYMKPKPQIFFTMLKRNKRQ